MESRPTDLITPKEAAALIPSAQAGKRTAVQTVYRMIFAGAVRAWKIGRHWRLSRADVLAVPVEYKPEKAPPRRARLTAEETAALVAIGAIRP